MEERVWEPHESPRKLCGIAVRRARAGRAEVRQCCTVPDQRQDEVHAERGQSTSTPEMTQQRRQAVPFQQSARGQRGGPRLGVNRRTPRELGTLANVITVLPIPRIRLSAQS
jgi:hypothetical protein